MSEAKPLFDWIDGVPYFRGLRVERYTLRLNGRSFKIVGLNDAADLLDHDDYAKRFLDEDVAPYGLELWPAARMLAEHVLAGEDGKGRSAVELGCGLGLVSIAAALKGWQVVTTDNEPTSLRFAQHNAELNHVDIAGFETLDWHQPPPNRRFHRVFAADVLYQLVDHQPVLTCVQTLLAPNGLALIADPNRGVADRFAMLAEEHGFNVHTTMATAPSPDGKLVNGRLYELTRSVDTQRREEEATGDSWKPGGEA